MNRLLTIIPAFGVLATSIACGSTSTSTSVSPSPVRCATSAAANPVVFTSAGGSGTLVVSAARECSWTASTQTPWITLKPPAEGQGDGSLAFSVAVNPAAVARRGTVTVGSHSVDLTQEAAPCRFELDRRSFDVAGTEATGEINVQAATGCAWTATSQTPWITIDEGGQGNGSGRVRFRVAANPTTVARSGALEVAGQRVEVRQRAAGSTPPPPPPPGDCAYAVDPTAADVPAAATDGTIAVQTNLGCSWTAGSDQGWLTIVAGGSGSGPGVVTYRAAANDNTADRTAHITVNGAVFTLRQAGASPPSCKFDLNPNSDSVPASGDNGSFDVSTGSLCPWTAAASAGWINITSGNTGLGDGRVEYTVDPNTSTSPRTGTITVVDRQFTIDQEAAPSQEPITVNGDARDLSGSCPNRTFRIGSQQIRTTSATNYDGGDCGDLRNNRPIRVTGIVGSDDVLTADEVQF